MHKKHLIIYDFDDENDYQLKWIDSPKNTQLTSIPENNESDTENETETEFEKDLTDFSIEIIDNKVKISLEFNVLINDKYKSIMLSIDIDKNTYLNIANKLK